MIIATAQFTIVDLHDPVMQGTEPPSPTLDMLWLDTSVSPNLLKRWNGETWEIVNDQAELAETVSNLPVTYNQWRDPALTHAVKDGDVWFRQADQQTHGNMAATTQITLSVYTHKALTGCVGVQYIRRNGEWHEAMNPSDYYEVQTGVDIVPEGISISGNRYVRVEGGSSVDIKGGSTVDIRGGSDVNIQGNSSVNIRGSTVDIQAGSKFKAVSGGSFEVFAQDEESYIKFGGTEEEPRFTLGSGGTVSAKQGVFEKLTVAQTSFMQTVPESMTDRMIVSMTQPSGHGILWIKPNAVSGNESGQVDYAIDSVNANESYINSEQTLTGFTRGGPALSSTRCQYGVKLRIDNNKAPFYFYSITVQAQGYINGVAQGDPITVYQDTSSQHRVFLWDVIEVDSLNTLSAEMDNITACDTVSLIVTLNKSTSDYIKFRTNERFILRCVGQASEGGSTSPMPCDIFFLP